MVRNGIWHHNGKVERRTMAYIRCVLVSKENKRVILQNGQREATYGIERHFPPVSRVSVA